MVGFLAPTISQAGASGGGVSTPVDTSVGDLLGNVGSIFDTVIRTQGQEQQATQTDRDRQALQPIADQLARIKKQRDAGLSPARVNAQATRVVTEALTLMPDKRSEIKNLATTIIGTEFLEPTQDPATAAINAISAELTNFDDPRNADLLFKAVEAAQTGEGFNQDVFIAEGARLISERDAEDAQLRSLKTQADIAAATNTLNSANQDQVAEVMFSKWTEKADLRIQNLTKTFARMEERFDRNEVITTLLREETQLTNEFNRQAADLLISDNVKTKFGSVAEAVRPLTNVREMLQAMREEDFQAWEERVRNDEEGFANFLRENGVPLASNREVQNLAATYVTAQFQPQISKAAREVHQTGTEITAANPFYQKTENNDFAITPEAEEKGSETIMSEEGTAVQQSLTDNEAKTVVKSGVAGFYAYDDLQEVNDVLTGTTVKNFSVALETMTNRGTPVTEETFDRVYNPTKFFRIYNNIQALGGPSANLLENAVRKNLAATIKVRERVASQNIDRVELPNLKLTFTGSNYDLVLDKPTTEFERVLSRELKKHGFKSNFEGIKKLQKEIRGQPGGTEVELNRGIQALLTDVEGHMKFLNKVVKTANNISEEMAGQVLPKTNTSSDPVLVADRDQFLKLEEGTVYRFENTDGTLSPPLVRGQEPFIRE